MKIDHNKLGRLVDRELPPYSPDALKREENVFFVGGNLPERDTLETLFESHFQSHASLFHITFGDVENFHNGEKLARMIKKNFNVHLVGRLDHAAPRQLIERAYAAGVDILDIPLTVSGLSIPKERQEAAIEERVKALESARAVFPRWSVVSTLVAGDEPAASTIAGIDALLAADVLPLVALCGRNSRPSRKEAEKIFSHLHSGWRRKKAAIKPLMPLIQVVTPLVPSAPRGVVRGFIDIIEDKTLLAASDLRRILRVKEVAESFDSAGL
jgi:hypothetical protein